MRTGYNAVIVIVLVFVACIWNSYNECLWHSKGVIVWDANCYYGYLQEAFNGRTHNDTVSADENNFGGLMPNQKYLPAPNGNYVLKTSMGMAFLYAPFYAVGYASHYYKHGNAGLGSEVEYRKAMQFFGNLMLLIGLFASRQLLKRYFSDNIVALTLLALSLGTNLFYYSTYESCMTHAANFALISIFMLLVIRWYRNTNIKNSILLGLLTGLIVLIRPTNILIGLLFLLYGITSLSTAAERFRYLLKHSYLILICGIAAILVWVPQMMYWYNLTGHFLYFSYGTERFYFDNPQIVNGMISGRKGWLLYTPMGGLMLLGFFWLRTYVKDFFAGALLFYVAFIYVIFSWWCWWYGGSFGMRAMVDAYAILVLPLAALFAYVYTKRALVLKVLLSAVVAFFIFLNLFQTYQYKKGIIHYSEMTFKGYQYVFLRTDQGVPIELREKPPGE